MDLLTAVLLLPLDIEIDPNSNGLPGIGQLKKIVGASMTVGLVLAVLALIPTLDGLAAELGPDLERIRGGGVRTP